MDTITNESEMTNETEMATAPISYDWIKKLCLGLGADDAGFVEIDRPELDDQREDILRAFPWARSVMLLGERTHRDSIRSPYRSTSSIEFHQVGESITATTRKVMLALQDKGIRCVAESWGFPMESDKWPGKLWFLSHKPIAEAAGLGKMGTNRMILHPKYGSFIFYGGVVIDAGLDKYDKPVKESPCLDCNLCVATCPTGAIGKDGSFNFASCVTHNYRYKLGGFSAWVEQVVDSANSADYRSRIDDRETFDMWQNLSHGSNTTCDSCLAVCPAGSESEPEFLNDKKGFVKRWVKPLQEAENKVFVVPGSDAEASVEKRFPHKEKRLVANNIRPRTIASFLSTMEHMFQPGQAKGLDATYHFTFSGSEIVDATITIKDQSINVRYGHHGKPDMRVKADSDTWIKFLAKEKSIAAALLTFRIVALGDPRLLLAFGKCFPS